MVLSSAVPESAPDVPGYWDDACRHLTKRYLVPEPRNALTESVRKYARAAMDVSDGLVGDRDLALFQFSGESLACPV